MSPAVASSLGIVAYLALFFGVGLLFIFVNLFVGRFLRPHNPHQEKLEIYECGEPTIGSSFVQFDLRFYVVALLFIIFDVEVAFFFPWATVFGKSIHVADSDPLVETGEAGSPVLTKKGEKLYQELGVRNPKAPAAVPPSTASSYEERFGRPRGELNAEQSSFVASTGGRQLAWLTIVDIAVFFAVLLVGFAYVWRRGDLDWVRAISRQPSTRSDRAPPEAAETPEEAALSV